MHKEKIFISHDLPKEAFDFLKRFFQVDWHRGKTLSAKQLAGRLTGCEGLLCSLRDPVTRGVLRASPGLRAIATNSAGVNHIDLSEARRLGIRVSNTPDLLTDATADLTWALILACVRRLGEAERFLRAGKFQGWEATLFPGEDLKGKTLGLYGFGRIGQAVAERASGWKMRVFYHQRRRLPAGEEKRLKATWVSFSALLRRSDILSVHAPLTEQTYHRFTLREFSKMKRTAVFVNTGRGPIHKEGDLAEALRRGLLFSAGLDVFEKEPKVHPALLRNPRCVLLPHIGSATRETRRAMALCAAKDLARMLRGRPPRFKVL